MIRIRDGDTHLVDDDRGDVASLTADPPSPLSFDTCFPARHGDVPWTAADHPARRRNVARAS
jgi:hypothetical protein